MRDELYEERGKFILELLNELENFLDDRYGPEITKQAIKEYTEQAIKLQLM